MAISKELLEILACPACRNEVRMAEHGEWLLCSRCKLKYPVRDDIPVMLIDKAEPLEE